MASEPIRDPLKDHLLTPQNSAFVIIDYQPIQVSSIRSMVNVKTGKNKPPIQQLQHVLKDYPTYDRTTINSWEDVEFKKAVVGTGRKKLVMTALWTEACLAFPALDALKEGYEVFVVADAVGGTSLAAHEAALRRVEQAGARLISKTQLYCELQRDWAREKTVPGFMDVFQSWDGFNPEKNLEK